MTSAGLVLIDHGLPVVARRVLEIVERDLRRPLSDIVSINCTHGHPDHVAGVSTLIGQTSCDVLLRSRCESYIDGGTSAGFGGPPMLTGNGVLARCSRRVGKY